jgi:protein-L-isoaspartate(D-aspartate) O-methyltransferase
VRDDFPEQRRMMVEHQLRARGIRDERVLEAFASIPREQFVPEEEAEHAYEDHPVPIGWGQTISQPYIVGLMTQCLAPKKSERILEIGTGSGYQTAVLCELAKEVYSVERVGELSERAAMTLQYLGYRNFHTLVADGTLGWKEHAPYDGIMVTASAPEVPESLKQQLVEGGRLVMPVGPRGMQTLMVLTCRRGRTEAEAVCECIFVKLIGQEGWKDEE